MKLGTIVILIGGILLVLGGFWYWQIMKLVPAFAGAGGTAANGLGHTMRYAVAVICSGILLVLVGLAFNVFFSKDDAG